MTILDTLGGSHKLLYNGNGMKLKAGGLFRRFLFVSSYNFCDGPADCWIRISDVGEKNKWCVACRINRICGWMKKGWGREEI